MDKNFKNGAFWENLAKHRAGTHTWKVDASSMAIPGSAPGLVFKLDSNGFAGVRYIILSSGHNLYIAD